jgi:hypothetical protein
VTLRREDVERFERCIKSGGVSIFPADTVYGLACSPDSTAAIERIYALKGRERGKPAALMFFELTAALDALPELGELTEEAVRRLLLKPERAIGEALIDQGVMAGPGNVYKSEACFVAGIDPFTPVGELDEDRRRQVVTAAARQLRANLGSIDRATDGGGGPAVYGRGDRPCRRCGATVQRAA